MSNNYFWHEGSCYKQIKGVAMGAKYAPSVANILLSLWEDHSMFGTHIPEICLYKRYIDDIVILWNSTVEALETFLSTINHNCYGLSFTGNWSTSEISFLDLTLYKNNGKILTKTHFKSTDRNSYIPTASCHHPNWLKGIPKGQLLRIRRNCDSMSDYMSQSNLLVDRFKKKGYQDKDLRATQSLISRMDRDQLLKDNIKEKCELNYVPFLTSFNRDYKIVERFFSKHWPVLLRDRTLSSFLPECPRFIYRRAPCLRNKLPPNVLTPPGEFPLFWISKGSFIVGSVKPAN